MKGLSLALLLASGAYIERISPRNTTNFDDVTYIGPVARVSSIPCVRRQPGRGLFFLLFDLHLRPLRFFHSFLSSLLFIFSPENIYSTNIIF